MIATLAAPGTVSPSVTDAGASAESARNLAWPELFTEVAAALLEFGDDRFLLFGLAEHQRAVLRVCRAGVVETGSEVADGLLQVLDLSLDTGQLSPGVVVRDVVCHLVTLTAY